MAREDEVVREIGVVREEEVVSMGRPRPAEDLAGEIDDTWASVAVAEEVAGGGLLADQSDIEWRCRVTLESRPWELVPRVRFDEVDVGTQGSLLAVDLDGDYVMVCKGVHVLLR